MKALILDNKVVDVVSTEFEVHSSMTWVDCDNTVSIGFDYKDGKFTDPYELTDAEKAQLAATEYIRLRKRSPDGYAPITDQLDMQYKDAINGTTTWKDHVAAVKAKYPKP
tara:strand:+ start:968 stop:1297 length:330 start_codon:yes stop_codon:yes gene_type:complete